MIKIKMFCHHQNLLLIKNTFKVAFEYLFNVFILFNTVSYLKLSFKLKFYPKMCTLKTWIKFIKTIWQPCLILYDYLYLLCNLYKLNKK